MESPPASTPSQVLTKTSSTRSITLLKNRNQRTTGVRALWLQGETKTLTTDRIPKNATLMAVGFQSSFKDNVQK